MQNRVEMEEEGRGGEAHRARAQYRFADFAEHQTTDTQITKMLVLHSKIESNMRYAYFFGGGWGDGFVGLNQGEQSPCQ